MPHPKFGKIGFLLCGGGCYEGCPQAFQVSEFIKAGIKPDSLLGVSVGALNEMDPERAAKIWEEYFFTHWAVYDLHPKIKRTFTEILTEIYDLTPRWKNHASWREFFRKEFYLDLKIQGKRLINLFRLAIPAIFSVQRSLPAKNENISLKDNQFLSLLRLLINEIQSRGLHKVSLLDLSPLFETIRRVINFENVLNDDYTRYFLVRHHQEAHIF